MENLQKFDDFKLNENWFTDIWQKTVKLFKKKYKKGAWRHLIKFLQSKDQMPKGVEVYFADTVKEAKIIKILEDVEHVDLKHADPNISNEDANEVREAVIDSYEFRKNSGELNSIMIWGAPGIGKTDIIQQIAEDLGLDLIIFHLSQIEPVEFRGVPKVEDIGGEGKPSDERTVNKLPAIFPTDNGEKGNGGILFLDELNRAPKMVLSAALPLCLDGKFADYELPNRWITVAAGNRPEDIGFDAVEIEPALANRFQHINYVPTVEAWTQWALNKPYVDPDLVGFLNFYKEYFHRLQKDDKSMAWASPRAWTKASHQVYNLNKEFKIDPKKKVKIYTRFVGTEAAVAFRDYLKLKEHFNENDVKDVYQKGKAKMPPTRLDQGRAAMYSIAFYKKGEKLKPEELENVMKYALSIKNFETKTALLSSLKVAHQKNKDYCYLKEEDPWKPIWWKYIKEWYKEAKNLGKEDEVADLMGGADDAF